MAAIGADITQNQKSAKTAKQDQPKLQKRLRVWSNYQAKQSTPKDVSFVDGSLAAR